MADVLVSQQYIPKGADTKEEGFWDFLTPNFSLRSITEYYAVMRFFGYMFEATYIDGARIIDQYVLNNKTVKEKFEKGELSKQDISQEARTYFNIFEAVGFLAVSTYNYYRDRKNYQENMGSAVAAELGVSPGIVGMTELSKSKNPIVKSVVNRFKWQNAIRFPSDIAFAFNLTLGIVAKAADITFERAAFVENVAFDILKNMITEVHSFNMGEYEQGRIFTGLIRAVQRSLSDDRSMKLLTKEQLADNKPVFSKLTELIATKKFGTNEAVYMLGKIIENPGHVQQNLREIELIEQMGIKDFALHKAGKYPTLPSGSKVSQILTNGKRSMQDLAQSGTTATALGVA